MEYTDEGLYASISVNSTAKENFILQKINTQLSLPLPSQKLYNGPLAIKPDKLKDIKDLFWRLGEHLPEICSVGT